MLIKDMLVQLTIDLVDHRVRPWGTNQYVIGEPLILTRFDRPKTPEFGVRVPSNFDVRVLSQMLSVQSEGSSGISALSLKSIGYSGVPIRRIAVDSLSVDCYTSPTFRASTMTPFYYSGVLWLPPLLERFKCGYRRVTKYSIAICGTGQQWIDHAREAL